jgi:PAS domain S-box-containing protein
MTGPPASISDAEPTNVARFAMWPWILVAVLVLMGGAGANVMLLRRADEARRVETDLATLASESNSLTALEWEATTTGRVGPELSGRVHAVTSRLDQLIVRLRGLGVHLPQLATVEGKLAAYMAVMGREFNLLEAGRVAEAHALDRTEVDPAFDLLAESIGTARDTYKAVSTRTVRRATLGTLFVMLFGPGCIMVVFWQLGRARHSRTLAVAANTALRRASTVLQAEVEERRRAQEEIRRLHEQITLILDSSSEGILGLDARGAHTFVNAAAARMLGYDAGELIGRDSHGVWHHSRPDSTPFPDMECPIAATLSDGSIQRAANDCFWKKDGSSFPVEYTSTPVRDGDHLTGAVVTFRDITERRATEAERDAVMASLQEALAKVRTLSGTLPICGYCRKIRDEEGSWSQFEVYVARHTDSLFSHGVCPDCLRIHFPEYATKGEK